MVITDVTITLTKGTGRQLADVAIVIDNELRINNIKLIDNGTKMFAAFPHSNSKSTSSDIFPISSEVREYIEKKIIEKYREVITEL